MMDFRQILFAVFGSIGVFVASAGQRPMALMVFFDGGRADCLENADCPNLHRLMDGTWAEGYHGAWSLSACNNLDMPTYSYGNHASLFCGVSAAKHGVLYNCQAGKGNYARWPSWMTRLLNARPKLKAAAAFFDGTDAKIAPDDRVSVYLGKNAAMRLIDDYRGPMAPDVACFFHDEPDGSGHQHGYYPSSSQYLAAFSAADRELGKVLDAIANRPTFKDEDWLVTFVTDHGGRARMHGVRDGHCHTIPLVLAGRRVAQGELVGRPRIYDLPVTLLAHFGVETAKMQLDGHVIGKQVLAPSRAKLADGLVCYVPFDGRVRYGTDVSPNAIKNSSIFAHPVGDLQYFNTGLTDRQSPSPNSMWLDGIDEPVGVCLDGSELVIADRSRGFTVSFWMRKYLNPQSEGETVIAGNRDLRKNGPGFVLRYNLKTPRFPPGVGLEYRDANGQPHVVGAFLQEEGQWNYYAVTCRPDGVVMFYQGRSDGKLHWMADQAAGVLLASGLPFHLGQDGTGTYLRGGHGGFDELKLWNRALTLSDVRLDFQSVKSVTK